MPVKKAQGWLQHPRASSDGGCRRFDDIGWSVRRSRFQSGFARISPTETGGDVRGRSLRDGLGVDGRSPLVSILPAAFVGEVEGGVRAPARSMRAGALALSGRHACCGALCSLCALVRDTSARSGAPLDRDGVRAASSGSVCRVSVGGCAR